MKNIEQIVFALMLVVFPLSGVASVFGTDIDSQDEKSASEASNESQLTSDKLEDLKNTALEVNRDLFILEEDLLFPASTQIAIYLSVNIGYFFSLDHIKLKIDDELVSHHLYTEKEVSALYRGGVQKVYIGNLSAGEHRLDAIMIGYGPKKREYKRGVSFTFEKTGESKALEVQLKDDSKKFQPTLKVVEW